MVEAQEATRRLFRGRTCRWVAFLLWTCEGGAAAGAGRAFSAHLSDVALDYAALFVESGGSKWKVAAVCLLAIFTSLIHFLDSSGAAFTPVIFRKKLSRGRKIIHILHLSESTDVCVKENCSFW